MNVSEEGIGNPSLVKSDFLEHLFPALRVSERERVTPEETSILHHTGHPSYQCTKFFPAGMPFFFPPELFLSKIMGMVGGEKRPVFLLIG